MKEILLKVGDDTMLITLTNKGGGTIRSSLSEDYPYRGHGYLDFHVARDIRNMLDAVESLVLAHACAGVDVQSTPYLIGLETALKAIVNNT
jgi:hypothetical protein